MKKPNSLTRETSVYDPIGSKHLKEEAVTRWTYREISWYLTENRLLFTTEDELEVHKWDLLFQWLLRKDER